MTCTLGEVESSAVSSRFYCKLVFEPMNYAGAREGLGRLGRRQYSPATTIVEILQKRRSPLPNSREPRHEVPTSFRRLPG